MSRTARLEEILRIVHAQSVANQAELVALLEERGVTATQATVSRDVRHLGLVKVALPDGGSRYLPPEGAQGAQGAMPSLAGLRPLFQQSVTQVDPGGAMLIVRTPIGFANAVALAVDGLRLPEVVGTIAGDDTLLMVLRSSKDRDRVLKDLRELLD